MKVVVFANQKSQRKIYKFVVSLTMYADQVFNDKEYFSAVDGNDGCEMDNYLIVRAKYKGQMLNLLCKAFYGISDTSGRSTDECLFYALERMARSGHWRSMDEIETWLMDREVPFTKQKIIVSDLR
jgi:hypothetical protein